MDCRNDEALEAFQGLYVALQLTEHMRDLQGSKQLLPPQLNVAKYNKVKVNNPDPK